MSERAALSPAEFAERMSLSKGMVLILCRRGDLRAWRCGTRWLIAASELTDWPARKLAERDQADALEQEARAALAPPFPITRRRRQRRTA